jgi:hypothetical protein
MTLGDILYRGTKMWKVSRSGLTGLHVYAESKNVAYVPFISLKPDGHRPLAPENTKKTITRTASE